MADIKEKAKDIASSIEKGTKSAAEKTSKVAKKVGESGKKVALKTKDTAVMTKEEVLKKIDQDRNGVIDSVDLILMAMKVPGVKVKRDVFLKKELIRYCEQDVIDKAIETTPAKAGIDPEIISKITDEVIKFERNAVSGISTALGMPGGVAMVATIPADIAQYYGYMIRAAQKMLYLYGFPELDVSDRDVQLDSETLNSLTVCLGVMYGVANASNAIKAMAKALGTGVEKQLLNKALTKGVVYPIVKNIAKWFGVRMTKEVFAGFFKKAIPVAGGLIGGGITYATFKPCCDRLKDSLKDTILSNPDHKESKEEKEIFEGISSGVIVDVEPDEIIELQIDKEPDEE